MIGIHRIEWNYSHKRRLIQIQIFENIMFLNSFSQFMNLNISIVPVCASMKFLPDVDNIHTEGTVSDFLYRS